MDIHTLNLVLKSVMVFMEKCHLPNPTETGGFQGILKPTISEDTVSDLLNFTQHTWNKYLGTLQSHVHFDRPRNFQ